MKNSNLRVIENEMETSQMSDANDGLRSILNIQQILPLVADIDDPKLDCLQFGMVFHRFAVIDPDIVRLSATVMLVKLTRNLLKSNAWQG